MVKAMGNDVEKVLSDPEVQEGFAQTGKALRYYKVKPRIADAVRRKRGDTKTGVKIASRVRHIMPNEMSSYKVEVISEQ